MKEFNSSLQIQIVQEPREISSFNRIQSVVSIQNQMISEGYTIDFDTSLKKYPYNKYFDCKELDKVAKRVFRPRTIDQSSKSRPKKKQSKKNKKSFNTTKTMSSSRARATSRQHNTLVSITPENCRAFLKEDIASQLHNYQELCLQLRKENHSLKLKLDEKSRNYKDKLVDIQKKINRFNEKSLQMREKELKFQQEKVNDRKSKERAIKGKGKLSIIPHRQNQGDFKRFFLTFMDNFGRVDDSVQKKVTQQKNMDSKLILGQKLLKQGCNILLQKKVKFKSVFE